jgi:hypothetical protein
MEITENVTPLSRVLEEDLRVETVPLDEHDLPSPPDVANIFLGVLLIIALLTVAYFAATICARRQRAWSSGWGGWPRCGFVFGLPAGQRR